MRFGASAICRGCERRDKNMYEVSFKENGKYFSFDFESQSEALKFFNFSRKLKERSEIIYKVI